MRKLLPLPKLPRRLTFAFTNHRLLRHFFVFIFFTTPLFLLPTSRLYAASQIIHTSKTDWQSGILVNATWYPETQIQLDWQGSSFTTPGHSPSEMWLAGWRYRRRITINNSLGYGLSDFQVWIPTSAFGAQWSAIRSSAQPTMADFRFTPSTATSTIPYWIDDNTTTPKGFWVRVSTLPAISGTTIYMYYGNSSASAGQSADDAFLFFDDFNGTLSKWINCGPESFAISGGILNITATLNDNYLVANKSVGASSIIIECDMKSNHTTGNGHMGILWHGNTLTGASHRNDHFYTRPHQYNVSGNIQQAYFNGSLIMGTTFTGLYNYNTWYKIKTEIITADNVKYYRDGVNEANINTAYYPTNTYAGIAVHAGLNSQWDNFRVRKCAPTEPTITSVGAEEGLFFSAGTHRSSVTDTASKVVVSSISWNPSSQPAGTNLAVSVRVSSFPFSINSSTPSWLTVTNGQTLNWHGRYIQYQSTFTTTNSTTTPRLENISIAYRVKPWQEKSVTRTPPNSFGFGGDESWEYELPVKSGQLATVKVWVRYNTEYGAAEKPRATLSNLGVISSQQMSVGSNTWEELTLSGTPSRNGSILLKIEGLSAAPNARVYADDITVSQ